MNDLELICFGLISKVGTARSMFIEAIAAAKTGDFFTSNQLIEEAQALLIEGNKIHFELIQKEAAGDTITINLLLMHSEDLLLSAEAFSILAPEFIDIHQRIINLEKKSTN